MSATAISNDDVQRIRSLADSAARFLAAGDFTSWAALYTEDATFMPPNSPRVQGRSAILAFIEAFPKVQKLEFSDLQVQGQGDLAVLTTMFSMTIVPEGQGETKDEGKQIVVLRKQADGQWLVSDVAFNSDLPVGN